MAGIELQSAIPTHLIRERTQPLNQPPQYEPPFPAYSSRLPESVKHIVVAVLGAQHRDSQADLSRALSKLITFVESDDVVRASRPFHWQLATGIDNARARNHVVVAYWVRRADFGEWQASSGFDAWWRELDAKAESNGWFREIFYPTVDRLETVFSGPTTPEGLAHTQEKFSGQIQEHVYWGSMRDRLPAAQTDALTGTRLDGTRSTSGVDRDRAEDTRGHIRVPGIKNLAVIRSGQDWSKTTPRERALYLDTMHPVLIRGMDFLRDEGEQVGCIANRFMEVLDPNTLKADGVEKTYGLGYFDDLSSLEKWSKQHRTHLNIFGGFLQYAKELQNNVSLQLFHEVLVLEPEQQEFEYVGCHPRTGMLVTLRTK